MKSLSASGLLASIRSVVSGEKWSLLEFVAVFLRVFGKLRLSDQVQLIAWHGIQWQIIWIFCCESEVCG